MKALTKEEIQRVEAQYSVFCGNAETLGEALREQFGDDAGEVQRKLEQGVDKFYETFSGTVSERTLQDKLEENMRAMTPKEKYLYLSNLLLALTQVCGAMVEGPEWNEALNDNKITLAGLASGAIPEDSAELETGIGDMLKLVAEQSHAFSALFIGAPSYQKLMQTCLTEENPAVVKAVAANTRQSAVNMAAALYLLQERDSLPSLKGVKIPPEEMGVMSASLLEMDAAQKSGSWERAKAIVEKAAKTAITLLVASPALIADAAALLLVGMLLSLPNIGALILGAILLVNARIHFQSVKAHLEPALNAGAKALDVTLDKVKDGWTSFQNWVSDSVLSKALSVWRRCRDFTVNSLMLPAAAFLLKSKSQIAEKWGVSVQAVKRFFNRAANHAADFMDRAAEYDASETPTETDGELEPLDEAEYAEEAGEAEYAEESDEAEYAEESDEAESADGPEAFADNGEETDEQEET